MTSEIEKLSKYINQSSFSQGFINYSTSSHKQDKFIIIKNKNVDSDLRYNF